LSQTGIDIVNGYISGEINPEYPEENDASLYGINQKQLRSLFNREVPPPGFDKLDVPVPGR
jgi:hypothetical protein